MEKLTEGTHDEGRDDEEEFRGRGSPGRGRAGITQSFYPNPQALIRGERIP